MKEKKKEPRSRGYKIMKPMLGFIFRIVFRPKIVNKELIPKKGPIVIAGNHRHLFDPLMAGISTKRVVHYMAKNDYYKNKWTKPFFSLAGTIPVDRTKKDTYSKEKALEYLNNDFAIGIFPEGTRNRTEQDLIEFKFGAVSLAQKSNAYVVPFAITGDYKWNNRNLTITFGKPFKVGKDDNLEDANNKLKQNIQTIIDKSGYSWQKKEKK